MLAVSLLVLGLVCVSCSEVDIIHYSDTYYSDPYNSPPPPPPPSRPPPSNRNWYCYGRLYYGPREGKCDPRTEEPRAIGRPCLEQCYPPGPYDEVRHNQYLCYCKPEFCREQTYGTCIRRR